MSGTDSAMLDLLDECPFAQRTSLRAQRGNPERRSPMIATRRSGLPRRLRLLAMTSLPQEVLKQVQDDEVANGN